MTNLIQTKYIKINNKYSPPPPLPRLSLNQPLPVGEAAQQGAEGIEVLVAQLLPTLILLPRPLQLAPGGVLVPASPQDGRQPFPEKKKKKRAQNHRHVTTLTPFRRRLFLFIFSNLRRTRKYTILPPFLYILFYFIPSGGWENIRLKLTTLPP